MGQSQRRQQLRAALLDALDPHVGREIEAGAAGFDHAQRRVVGRERTPASPSTDKPSQCFKRALRGALLAQIEILVRHDQHREYVWHAKSAHHQESVD